MFEAITAFLVILSVGILVAHALDAFRSWKEPSVARGAPESRTRDRASLWQRDSAGE